MSVSLSARQNVRRYARLILSRRHDVTAQLAPVHWARVHASLELEGIEPVQGALADLFGSFGKDKAVFKGAALLLATPRLGSRVARRFKPWVASSALPPITSLATRWSLIVSASADTSTRSRRCSADDSRRLAMRLLAAFESAQADSADPADQAEVQAQQAEFLHHCLTCQDRLAFMIARRELLKRCDQLPDEWEDAQNELQGEGIF